MIDERHDPDPSSCREYLLSERRGGRSDCVGINTRPAGSIVIRCRVIDAPDDVPPSVIVKKTRRMSSGIIRTSRNAEFRSLALQRLGGVRFSQRPFGAIPLSPLLYGEAASTA